MITLSKRIIVFGFLIVLMIAGYLWSIWNRQPGIKLGDHYIDCNPNAKINPKKRYNLRLWDYNWPIGKGKNSYQHFMEEAIADFRKIYPNINVQLTLLDFLNGETELVKAIETDKAPDLYCSAFSIPKFYLARQIPVGPYLNREDINCYFPAISKMSTLYGTQCYFPRWVVFGIWVGNRALMEKAGLSITKIRQESWTLPEIDHISTKVPVGSYLMAGNLGYNGFLPQFVSNATAITNHKLPWSAPATGYLLDFLEKQISRKKIPSNPEANMIESFLKNQVLLVAGVRPVLYRFLKQKLIGQGDNREPVILPPPGLTGPPKTLLVENGVIAVYKSKLTRGDDQIAAAVRLGQFLSLYNKTGPWQSMLFFPAAKTVAASWRKQVYSAIGDTSVLDKLVTVTTLYNLEKPPGYQEIIVPALYEFCNRRITKEQFKSKLINL